MPSSTTGCAEYGGINKMFARLQLSGTNWHLGRFKDDLPDQLERDELEESVLERLTPILEKCSTASISAKLAEMTVRVNELVPDALSPRRPHHLTPPRNRRGKKQGKSGYVDPESSDDGGPAKGPRQLKPKDTLLITFDGNDADHGIGVLQPGRTNRVDLASDNTLVADLLAHRDMSMAARALNALAFCIYEQGLSIREPELPYATFGQRVSHHLKVDDVELSKSGHV
jgi:hypothetical protein